MFLNYRDDEVRDFHPICEQALENALTMFGKGSDYKVAHHEPTGDLEMDFAIQNKKNGKYLCVIEVKKTPADVQSTRNQLQAMNYVRENDRKTERPFYMVTNLETAALFRYDASKPRVYQQMIAPGFTTIGSFAEEKAQFIDKLAKFFADSLQAFINDDYEYLKSLTDFVDHMEQIKHLPGLWKSHLAIFMYEYINGVLAGLKKRGLTDINLLGNDIEEICAEAGCLNLNGIFDYSPEKFENLETYPEYPVDSRVMNDLFELGKKTINGNSIAEVLSEIISADEKHEGEVSTDPELARITAELARHEHGNLEAEDIVCDPAAGIGNLLEAAISTWALNPAQIMANEINPQLADALSLKMGLNFAGSLGENPSLNILCDNLANLKPELFRNVKVVLANPPFIVGIDCKEKRQPFYEAIEKITEKAAVTNVEHMQFEGAFLELLVNLLQPGTTVACIIPNTHLTASGGTAQKIRKLLLDQFGLRLIFTYPGEKLFNSVVKDTCIIVGRVKSPAETIKIMASSVNVPQIGLDAFSQALKNGFEGDFAPIMPGIQARNLPIKELEKSVKDGWRMLNAEMHEGMEFIRNNFANSPKFVRMKDIGHEQGRGKSGCVSGGSDLIFIDSKEEIFSKFQDANLTFFPGMRLAGSLKTLDAGKGDRRVIDLSGTANDELIEEIISEFIKFSVADAERKKGKQPRKPKSPAAWRLMLVEEQGNSFPKNSVLFPRGIRRAGKVAITKTPMHISTNFLVVSLPDADKALLMGTFASTIFFQLMCEIFSKNQEGMRKMEMVDFQKTFLPKFEDLPAEMLDDVKENIQRFSFLKLDAPKIRPIDKIWANYLFGEKADALLREAMRILKFLTVRRRPYRKKAKNENEDE